MKLLVGLGNPGREYKATRHNLGFMAVDLLTGRLSAKVSQKKFSSLFGIVKMGDNDVCVVKPQTFMNLSGNSVVSFASYYKIDPKDILVVHDDIDMSLARMKFVSRSGDGGHNGAASIIESLGTNEFWRLKIGIGRPEAGREPAEYVLEKFGKAEKPLIEETLRSSAEAIEMFFVDGPERAMQVYNGIVPPVGGT